MGSSFRMLLLWIQVRRQGGKNERKKRCHWLLPAKLVAVL